MNEEEGEGDAFLRAFVFLPFERLESATPDTHHAHHARLILASTAPPRFIILDAIWVTRHAIIDTEHSDHVQFIGDWRTSVSRDGFSGSHYHFFEGWVVLSKVPRTMRLRCAPPRSISSPLSHTSPPPRFLPHLPCVSSASPQAAVTWSFNLFHAGLYDVEMTYRPDVSRARNAPLKIENGGEVYRPCIERGKRPSSRVL
jgi:hypothetical protein